MADCQVDLDFSETSDMKTFGKILLGLVLVVVLAVAGVLTITYFNLDSIVKKIIEEAGSQATQTSVQLDSVSLSLSSGSASLSGLSVANPKGFNTPTAFELNNIKVTLDIASIKTDVIHIKSIIVDTPVFTYETSGGHSDSNFNKLLQNVQSSGGSGNDKGAAESADKSPQPKVIIDLVQLKKGTVHLLAPKLKQDVSATMPDIKLTDIGKKSGGATIQEASKQILASIQSKVSDVAAKELEKALRKEVEGRVQKQLDKTGAGGIGDSVKGLFK